MTTLDRLRALHRALLRQSFYPLVLASALDLGLLRGRDYISGSRPYAFLHWDLFLAWAPYFLSLVAAAVARRGRRSGSLVALGAVWLIFFPNAPYLLTEIIQLHLLTPRAWIWFDIGLFGAFALTGCFLTVASLHTMQNLVQARLGRLLSWAFVLGVLALTGLGIYLGRFLRWNSWDIIANPRALAATVVGLFTEPANQLHTFGFTGTFAALLLICYVTFVSMRAPGDGLPAEPAV